MNCVYHAYAAHMWHMGIKVDGIDGLWYNLLKRITHGREPQPTWGGVVPWMIGRLSKRHDCVVEIQHKIWTPAHYEADASNWRQCTIAKNSDFGKEIARIDLAPAIYLMLHTQHAVFSTGVPKRLTVMALQIRKKEKRND